MSNATIRRMLMAALLLGMLPATGHAQLGGLKKLKDKAAAIRGDGGSKASSNAGKQWKPGERVPPLTLEALDRVIARWQAELEYNALSDKEKIKRDDDAAAQRQALEAKKNARDKCVQTVSPDDLVPLMEKMQTRVMELGQAGDPNAATKAYQEMQNELSKMMAKKCGPELKDEAGGSPLMSGSDADYKLREWLTAYLAILAERDPEAAAAFVLATEDEVKLIESRMTQLKQLMATEFKKN